MLCPTFLQESGLLSHHFGSYWVDGGELFGCNLCVGGVHVVVMGGGVLASSRFVVIVVSTVVVVVTSVFVIVIVTIMVSRVLAAGVLPRAPGREWAC